MKVLKFLNILIKGYVIHNSSELRWAIYRSHKKPQVVNTKYSPIYKDKIEKAFYKLRVWALPSECQQ